MKKLLLANVALAALVAAPAMAADMPVKYKAPPPLFSWTGCYGGANLGYFGGLDKYDVSPSGRYAVTLTPAAIAQARTSYSPGESSYSAGVQVGCNYQFGK